MPTGLYFPTCIYNDRIELSESSRNSKIAFLRQCREKQDMPFRSMSGGGFTSFNTVDQLHRSETFTDVFGQIMRHVVNFSRDLGADVENFQPHFQNTWGNIYPTGEYVKQHNHANSVLSGVYYLSCPPGTGGTYFVSPLEYARALDFPRYCDRTVKNFEEVYFNEEDGRLIIFPGWLKHYTDANQSGRERVILSFNISFLPAEFRAATGAPAHA